MMSVFIEISFDTDGNERDYVIFVIFLVILMWNFRLLVILLKLCRN